jgi:hypothetical protein
MIGHGNMKQQKSIHKVFYVTKKCSLLENFQSNKFSKVKVGLL